MRVFLILPLLVTFNAFGQHNQSTLKKLKLVGKVKYFEENSYIYDEKDGKQVNIEKRCGKGTQYPFDEHISFDKNGNEVEEDDFGTNGKLAYKHIILYNSIGNEIERDWYKPDGTIVSKSKLLYDSAGHNSEVDSYDSRDSVEQVDFYKYDTKGDLIENIGYEGKKQLYKLVYKNSDSGKKIETIGYSNGKVDLKWIDYYDENGNKIEEITRSADTATIKGRNKYQYDNYGNQIEIKGYDFDTIQKKFQLLSGSWITARYEYDSKGNWTKKIISDHTMVIRKIEYY